MTAGTMLAGPDNAEPHKQRPRSSGEALVFASRDGGEAWDRAMQQAPSTPAGPRSDDALMAAVARHNDAQSFNQLVTRYEGHVRRFCAALLSDAEAGRQAAYDTFLTVWRARRRPAAHNTFRIYLFMVARRLCIARHMRHPITRLLPRKSAPSSTRATTDTALEPCQRREWLQAALSHVPLKLREPLLLRFVENLSYEDIGQIIARPPSQARSRVFRGLRALEAQLPPEAMPWNA